MSQVPNISQLHFLVGGDRFRTALEVVLEMLIREFGVDHEPDWQAQLGPGEQSNLALSSVTAHPSQPRYSNGSDTASVHRRLVIPTAIPKDWSIFD